MANSPATTRAPTVPEADSAAVKRSLGSLGALYLEKVLTPGDVIATAWGATMLEVVRSAHRAILGIGKVAHDAMVVRAEFLSPVQMDELRLEGAVGDMLGRFFDVQGRPVATELDGRIITLSLQDLKTMSPVIAVAGGENKSR